MSKLPLILLFVAVAFVSWGNYGPLLHEGQDAMGRSLLRPFICVGIAYFLVAVLVPWIVLGSRPESGGWSMRGVVWSLMAGTVGALGALGIILAFKLGGKPLYVMPLVFGCAPVINTVVTMFMQHTGNRAGVLFYASVLTVAVGAAGVLYHKPKPPRPASAQATATENAPSAQPAEEGPGFVGMLAVVAAVAATAVCWGSYGPTLHKGQAEMGGSRLRPFICVGLAYFVIAVLFPLLALSVTSEQGHFAIMGSLWSFLAGAAGAVGALGVILAFNFGGKPIFVMPLVFGGAPVVNTFASMGFAYFRHDAIGEIGPLFLASIGLVVVGAVCVLLFAPRAAAKPSSEGADMPDAVPEVASREQLAAATEDTGDGEVAT